MAKQAFFVDEFQGLPLKRALSYILKKREEKKAVVGVYCTYAPIELIYAADAIPAILCAFANGPITKAEEVLPANLCPLIKSSYGFIQLGTCPFFELTDAVVGETTCDGKKKMFELISEKRPMFVMDLPQNPKGRGALDHWKESIQELKNFLEKTLKVTITEEKVREAIKENQEKNALIMKIFDYASHVPSVVSWTELYDVACMGMVCCGSDLKPKLLEILSILENRVKNEDYSFAKDAPRVLVTGSPLGGDTFKVYKLIEEEGGVVVSMDSCTGRKSFVPTFDANEKDVYAALAKRYLEIPCACMSPNDGRFTELSTQIEKYKVHAVVDVVLQACHTYNIESHRVEKFVSEKYKLPFLKVVTDYSQEDVGQLKTRLGALLEMANT